MLDTRQKWTFRSLEPERRLVVIKKRNESGEHVLMKALLWGLYLPLFPESTVEVSIGGRYKPDVVELDGAGEPRFWAEAGHVGKTKLQWLVRRHPAAHLAFGKWGGRPHAFEDLVARALDGVRRRAPVDVLGFPQDSFDRFVDADGTIRIQLTDLRHQRFR